MKTPFLCPAILLAFAIEAADLPKMSNMKEGLWMMRDYTVQHPSGEKAEVSGAICQKPGWNNGPMKVKVPKGKCKSTIESDATKQRYEAVCKVDEVQIKMTETREIVDNNAARTVVEVAYDPPVDGKTGVTITAEATFLSACPADMKPGDQKLPDGTIQRGSK